MTLALVLQYIGGVHVAFWMFFWCVVAINRDTKKNEFVNRMGAPVAIGGVVAATRNALWFFPSTTGDTFADYPDRRINRKFRPVRITPEEYNSQYEKISGTEMTASAVSASSPSPIDSGGRLGFAPMVHDS